MRRATKRDGWWPFFILMPMTVFWIGCMCFFLGRISTRPGTVQFVMSPQGGEEELQEARDLQEYVNHSASLVRIRRILDFVARAPPERGATLDRPARVAVTGYVKKQSQERFLWGSCLA
ncbi:hypothetical protein CDAR_99721 [Caerostris darwini]|uniref:Uncharacterized protein n=1 Tax=Caerostris darwini TaxID=1538125 RepID=A0AAV4SLZ7_9ARAC|nr:hypothetical protein CDAR_99721 [Caerostris darwini]